MKELKGLQIVKSVSSNGHLTLTLSNGKELQISGGYNYVNQNNFEFSRFNGTKFALSILTELESQYFSLKNVNQEMSTDLKPEDVLSFELSVDVTDETVTVYAKIPVDILKDKTIDWEENWFDKKEEIERYNENVVEISYIDLATTDPKGLYRFLKYNTTN